MAPPTATTDRRAPGRLDRDDWLTQAWRAFVSGGIGAVSVNDLARQLGVSRGSFYHHFTDREDLLQELRHQTGFDRGQVQGAVGVHRRDRIQLGDEEDGEGGFLEDRAGKVCWLIVVQLERIVRDREWLLSLFGQWSSRTAEFLPLSCGLLFHCQILLLMLSSQSREYPKRFDRSPGRGQEIQENSRNQIK